MNWKNEWKSLALYAGLFAVCYHLPVDAPRFERAVMEALHLVKWYAREHVLLCLIPAFFIAGAIAVFISQKSVMKYLGPAANPFLAYGTASISGTVLAVCSCTVLPLFAGIYRMGAGLGPACAFLYAGPAINVLAIILTTRVLGVEMGIARVIGAIVFSILIGVIMRIIFHHEEVAKAQASFEEPESESSQSIGWNLVFFASLLWILVFANWARTEETRGILYWIYVYKWYLVSVSSIILGVTLIFFYRARIQWILLIAFLVAVSAWLWPHTPSIPFLNGVIGISILASFSQGELGEWVHSSWDFAKQILPLLFIGVLAAGLLLGRPDQEGLIPSGWINGSVGGNAIAANLFAAIAGAFMYFATLTEIPILQGLLAAGMGKGPALALLLAGPALSLPNMLVIRSIMGSKKTIVYVTLVIAMATISGWIYGNLF